MTTGYALTTDVLGGRLPESIPVFRDAARSVLASVLDQSADCIKVIALDGVIEFVNPNGLSALEIDNLASVAGQLWAKLWPAEAQANLNSALALARTGQSSRFEAFCPTAKGSPRWWDVSISPVRDPDGEIVSFISVSRDITFQVTEAKALALVNEEVRHRLMNCYTMAGALIRGFARGDPDHERFAHDMVERLNGLAVAQTLTAIDNTSCRLADLVPAVMTPFAALGCPLTIGDFGEARVDQGQADAIAVVLGELSVNSTKHGALSSVGTIAVTHPADGGPLDIHWSERSDRPVAAHAREHGKGLAIMTRILAARHGTIDIEWHADGLDAVVRFGTD